MRRQRRRILHWQLLSPCNSSPVEYSQALGHLVWPGAIFQHVYSIIAVLDCLIEVVQLFENRADIDQASAVLLTSTFSSVRYSSIALSKFSNASS